MEEIQTSPQEKEEIIIKEDDNKNDCGDDNKNDIVDVAAEEEPAVNKKVIIIEEPEIVNPPSEEQITISVQEDKKKKNVNKNARVKCPHCGKEYTERYLNRKHINDCFNNLANNQQTKNSNVEVSSDSSKIKEVNKKKDTDNKTNNGKKKNNVILSVVEDEEEHKQQQNINSKPTLLGKINSSSLTKITKNQIKENPISQVSDMKKRYIKLVHQSLF
jgi:hypothetical protein